MTNRLSHPIKKTSFENRSTGLLVRSGKAETTHGTQSRRKGIMTLWTLNIFLS